LLLGLDQKLGLMKVLWTVAIIRGREGAKENQGVEKFAAESWVYL
jgi:hypothetical protein